ncbi:MAG TPA: hypothetical protein VHD90_24320 [Phototrophicaceae bacterium]|nr:hypothetical protein [Phototrophicaceae bacterium]
MVNHDRSAPDDGEHKIRLSTGEVITREELLRRVNQRVWELLQEDLRISRERGGALRPKH